MQNLIGTEEEGNKCGSPMDIIAFIGFLALVIIGIAIVLFIVRLIWMLLPAALVAAIVFFLTFDLWWTGMAFLAIAVLTVVWKILKK